MRQLETWWVIFGVEPWEPFHYQVVTKKEDHIKHKRKDSKFADVE
jgi:hypothetical protein